MARNRFIHLGPLGAALLLVAPAFAQLPDEPPARRAAALADYRQTCASFIGPYIEFYVNHSQQYFRQTREVATSEADNQFLYGRDDGGSHELPDQYRGLRSVNAMRTRVRNATQEEAQYGKPNHRLHKCAVEVALRHAISGVPGYDLRAGAARPSAPTQRPKAASPVRAPASASAPARPAQVVVQSHAETAADIAMHAPPRRWGLVPDEALMKEGEIALEEALASPPAPDPDLKGLEESKCLVFTPSAAGTSALGRIRNDCPYRIEGMWCVEGFDCQGGGNMHSFCQKGARWGTETDVQGTQGGVGGDRVYRAACRGANTIHGSAKYFNCTKPDSSACN